MTSEFLLYYDGSFCCINALFLLDPLDQQRFIILAITFRYKKIMKLVLKHIRLHLNIQMKLDSNFAMYIASEI